MDKGHTMMPMDADDEFEIFYDDLIVSPSELYYGFDSYSISEL